MTSCTSPRPASSARYSGWSSTAASVVPARLEVVDRLEQRRDADRAGRSALGAGVEQADLLEQDGDLEHVADRLAHADHVVRDRRGPSSAHLLRGGHAAGRARRGPARTARRRGAPAAGAASARRPAAPPGPPRRGRRSRRRRRPRPAARRAPPRGRRSSAACPGRRGGSRRPRPPRAAGPAGRRPARRRRGCAARRRRRRGRRAARRASRRAAAGSAAPVRAPGRATALRGGGQPRGDAVERPPVGLVGAERRVVAGRPRRARRAPAVGVISRSDIDSSSRSAVSSARWWASAVSACRVVARRSASAVTNGLPSRSPPIQEPGSSIGPAQQPGVGPALVQRAAQLGVDRRDDVEQRQLVVAQRLVDLVLQPQPGQPQQRRLPEGEHRAPQLGRPRASSTSPPAARSRCRIRSVTCRCTCEIVLPPHLGGVRGDDRADQRAGQLAGDDVGVEVRPGRAARRSRPGCPAAAASPRAGGTGGAARGACPRRGWPAARSG